MTDRIRERIANREWNRLAASSSLNNQKGETSVKTVVGIFETRREATEAANRLQAVGFAGPNIILLTPGASEGEIEAVPTEDAEQPGMGKAIGSVVGGALGLGAGAVIASLVLPGVGTVLALTLGAAAGGVGGAAAGGAAGGALENTLSNGVPKDEIFFYEDALRQGRAVVIGLSEKEQEIEGGREVLQNAGAETLDAAREKWWIGLRDAEETLYSKPDFKDIEKTFRRGFSAALQPSLRGRSLKEAAEHLKKDYPDFYQDESFRRGFERGQEHFQKLQKEPGR
jgi:hypothetical protein